MFRNGCLVAVARVCLGVLMVVSIVASLPASADVRILASPGGEVGPFLDFFARLRASGQRVVIDGPCFSACTLVLVSVPQSRLCVTPRAVFGFHGARSVDDYGRTESEPEATRVILASYPPPVRLWIERHGGLTSRVLVLRGRALAAMFRRCR